MWNEYPHGATCGSVDNFSSCLSCFIHIYINTTEIHHCRNFTSVCGLFLGDRDFSAHVELGPRVRWIGFAAFGRQEANRRHAGLKVKAVIESVSRLFRLDYRL